MNRWAAIACYLFLVVLNGTATYATAWLAERKDIAASWPAGWQIASVALVGGATALTVALPEVVALFREEAGLGRE